MRSLLIVALSLCAILNVRAQTYPASWIDKTNVTVNGDNSLTKSVTTNGYVSGAASANVLLPDVNGYIEFKYPGNTSAQFLVSLTTLNNQTSYANALYSFYCPPVTTGTYYIYERSVAVATLAGLKANDVLRIERSGSDINYYRNGALLKTTTLAANNKFYMRADVSLGVGTAPSVTCSFGPKLMARPTIVYPTHGASNGSISLVMEGGTEPYTYAWSTSETGASISGKPYGEYTVLVTDANGLSFSARYALQYDVSWKNLVLATINANNTLTRQGAGNVFNAGASSTNTLPQGEDGWMEVVIADQTAPIIMGFSETDIDASHDALRYTLYFMNTGVVSIYENGTLVETVSSIMRGDVFRLSRIGTDIVYTQNGHVLRRVAGSDTKPQFITDVTINTNDSSTPQITLSYDRKKLFKPTITLPTSANNDGGLSMVLEGTYPDATISWSSNETGTTLAQKPRDKYTITVSDAAGSVSREYNLLFPVRWSDLRNVRLLEGGPVQKIGSSNSYNSGAISGNRLMPNTDGFMETVVNRVSLTTRYVVGLTKYNTTVVHTGIDYGFYVNYNNVSVMENGSSKAVLPFVEGTILKIAREGSLIVYYVDGVNVLSTPTPPENELRIDCSIYGGTVFQVSASFDYTPRQFYAIADGDWSSVSSWSLTEGGVAGTECPTAGDEVYVKGKKITVSNGVSCKNLNIQAINSNTGVFVDGSTAILSVSEEISVKGVNNADVVQAFKVQNQGTVNVKEY